MYPDLSNDQFGFRKGVGTREDITAMRLLSERCIDYEQNVYVCFVDYEKAFGSVDWVKLLEVLKSIGVDWRDRRLTERLYMGQRARVRVKDGLTNAAVIGRGTRQGCLLSLVLFNIYAEAMLRDALSDMNQGIRTEGRLIKTVRYADDQATVASSAERLQHMMDKMQETATEYGMTINIKKTKVITMYNQQETWWGVCGLA